VRVHRSTRPRSAPGAIPALPGEAPGRRHGAARARTVRPPAGSVPALPRPGRTEVRTGLAVLVGALWWVAALRLGLRPGPGGGWQAAMLAGGWSLGLIPMHAVPVPRRGTISNGMTRSSGPTPAGIPGDQPSAGDEERPEPPSHCDPEPGAEPGPGPRPGF
jgi:hypothetical protein